MYMPQSYYSFSLDVDQIIQFWLNGSLIKESTILMGTCYFRTDSSLSSVKVFRVYVWNFDWKSKCWKAVHTSIRWKSVWFFSLSFVQCYTEHIMWSNRYDQAMNFKYKYIVLIC